MNLTQDMEFRLTNNSALPLQDDAIAATGLIHPNGGVDQMEPGHSATRVDYITPN